MDSLPAELVQYILNCLSLRDLLTCSRVNKQWNTLVNDAPEYDFLYIPKVVKLVKFNGYRRQQEVVYICDHCFDQRNHKQCLNCNRLYCLEQYPWLPRDKCEYCMRCLHNLGQTYCNRKWKECRLTLRLRDKFDKKICYDCFDKGCGSCHKKADLYFIDIVEFGKVCEECYEQHVCQVCKRGVIFANMDGKKLCCRCYENIY